MRERERGGGSRVINLFDDDDRLVDGGGEKILEKFVVFVVFTISHLSFDDDDDGKMHLAADDDRFSMKKNLDINPII